jgi:carbon storage regulator
MLVLSRKIGNRIVIAGNIEIIVLQVHGNRVRLGVSAPQDVSIVRCDARKQDGRIDAGRHPLSQTN